MRRLRIGDYDCFSLSDGYFRLDGGAMFGVVPRTLWGSFYAFDELNRIRLGLTSLLIAGRGVVVLVEGGVGQVFDGNKKLAGLYSLESAGGLDRELAETGFAPADITHVVYTHLHWDHAGTACKKDRDGRWAPRFPRARYYAQRGEWDEALSDTPASRASYLAATLAPVAGAGLLHTVEGNCRLTDDISLEVTGGHTRYHQVVLLRSAGQGLIFWGDLVPTSKHVHLPHIMAYDRYPEDTYAQKERLMKETCAVGFISTFPHDVELGFGRIRHDGKRYLLAETL